MKKYTKNNSVLYDLDVVGKAWGIPGGAGAVESLLLATGFLKRAHRSKNLYLPCREYLDLGYFRVIYRSEQGGWQAVSFCVTSKGLGPVRRKLRRLGLHIPDPIDTLLI